MGALRLSTELSSHLFTHHHHHHLHLSRPTMLLPLHIPWLLPTPSLNLLMVLLRKNVTSIQPSIRSQALCCLKSSSSRISHSLQTHVLMAHSMEMEPGLSSILEQDLGMMMTE